MQTLIELFELNGLIPPDLILWLTIGSDLLIALAYYSIALGLVYFIRQGKDFSHPWLFVMLAIFFIACGTMHLLAVTTIWIRLYWLEIFIKTFTALTSIVAAISIFWLIRLTLKFLSQKNTPVEIPCCLEQQLDLLKMNQTLLESEARWASLFSSMTNGFALHEVIRDAEGKVIDYRFLDVNLAFEKMTGIPRDSWIGKRVKEVLPNTEDYWIENYGKVVSSGEPSIYENYADNLGRWFSTYAYRTEPEQFAVIVEDITERKQAEEMLDFHSKILNNIAEGVQLSRAEDEIIVYTNPQFDQMFGYESGELLGKHVCIVNAPDSKSQEEVANSILAELMQTGLWSGEIQNIKKDGTAFWCYAKVSTFEHPKFGRVWVSVHDDITARKETEKALQESEREFRTLADVIPQIIWITQANGGNIYLNQQWVDYTGLTLEESAGQNWITPVHPDDKQVIWEAWQQATQTGGEYSLESRFRRFDGVYRWWLIRGVPLCDEKGKILKWFGTCTDIDDIKNAQSEILATKNQLQATLDATPDLLFELDFEGRYCDYHAPRTELLAAPPEQFLGRKISEVLSPDAEAICLSAMRETQQQGWSTGKQIKLEFAQRVHWFELSVAIKPTDNAQQPHFIMLSRDITNRKQAEMDLRASEQRFRQLFQHIPLPLGITNKAGQITYINHRFEQLFGYSSSDIPTIDDWWLKAYPDVEYRQWVIELWETAVAQAALNNTEVEPFEYKVSCKDGSVRIIVFSGFRFADDFLVVGIDVTERTRIEEKLRENENRLNAILDNVEAYIYIKDKDYRYQYANKLVCELFGQPLEAIIGKTDEDFFDATTAENLYKNDSRVIELDERIYTEETNINKANGISATYLSIKQPLYYDDALYGLCGISTDITERRRLEETLKASEEKFRSIINASPVPMALNDAQQNITFLNPAFTETFGYDLSDIPTLADWWIKAYPDATYRQWVIDTWYARLEQVEGDLLAFTPIELNIVCKDNSQKTVLTSAAMISHTFNDVHLVVLYDITERKKTEAELRIAARVFDAQEGMLIADANEIILNVNQAFTAITGYSASEVIGQTPRLLASGRHDKAFYTAMGQSIKDTGAWRGEIWNRRKNGEVYPEWLTISAVKSNYGEITHYVATLTDISERKSFEEHIHRLAFYDPLTQLPNRRLLQERLKHGIEVSRRTGGQLAVLMLDLDKFKAVNDSLGHVIGDELLQQVADCIKTHLREIDTVARLGGDEFIVLIENIEHDEYVARVADNIIQAISRVFTVRNIHQVYISTSIGISIYPQHGNTVEVLLSNADAALYHAKAQGRGCFAYFSEDLTQKARLRIALETRLRRAIEQQEFRVYFQPQIDVNTGQLIGAEALVRWHDPVHGFVMPGEFIQLAEETGLIIAIGEWVLRETCRLGRQWLDQGFLAITLAVNVSPYQFRRSDINALVTKVLCDTGFPVEYLELEITESGLMENQAHAMTILNNLHHQGVRLAIDDFGTGYSSLAYLKYFPLDVLKIDKTFIDDIPFSQGDMTITSTIIAMAGHLGFKVLAEGVETLEQLEFLQQQGCDVYQGYLYSKAISADDFAKLLTIGVKKL